MATLCWDCAKACGDCSWSGHDHTPVPGWTATEVHKEDPADTSYIVTDCPLFMRDGYRSGLSRKPPLTEEERLARKRESARIASAKKYRRQREARLQERTQKEVHHDISA